MNTNDESLYTGPDPDTLTEEGLALELQKMGLSATEAQQEIQQAQTVSMLLDEDMLKTISSNQVPLTRENLALRWVVNALQRDVEQAQLQTPDSEEIELMLQRAAGGSEVEQNEALEGLYRYASDSNGDPDSWNAYALGLHNARRFDEAIEMFSKLVEAFPATDIYRLSLATTFSQTAQFDLCKYHLRYLVEKGTTEEVRKIAVEQLEGMEKFLKQTEKDQELQQLQLKGLREVINSGEAAEEDFMRLARLLLMIERADPAGPYLDEATQMLEKGKAQFPDAVPIIEHLVLCYTRKDPAGKLDGTLDLLEKVAPNSNVLKIMRDIDSQEAEEFSQQTQARAFELIRVCQSDEPDMVASALKELQRIVNFYQSSPFYRNIYAFALLVAGRKVDALEQAEIVAAQGPETHSEHFNLGQVFWGCGDPIRGRHHLDLALKLAGNDEERQEVLDRIVDLESRE